MNSIYIKNKFRNSFTIDRNDYHMLVAKDNVKALRSYQKLTFVKVGEYVLQGHDYWCYEKKL